MACEVDIIWQYLQQICIHHIEFKVCLVSYPFVHAVFSTFANSEKSIFLCGLFKKCIIKQLLNSVFFFLHYMDYLTLFLCYLPQPAALVDNTYLGFSDSCYHAQTHPTIAHSCFATSNLKTLKRLTLNALDLQLTKLCITHSEQSISTSYYQISPSHPEKHIK